MFINGTLAALVYFQYVIKILEIYFGWGVGEGSLLYCKEELFQPYTAFSGST